MQPIKNDWCLSNNRDKMTSMSSTATHLGLRLLTIPCSTYPTDEIDKLLHYLDCIIDTTCGNCTIKWMALHTIDNCKQAKM